MYLPSVYYQFVVHLPSLNHVFVIYFWNIYLPSIYQLFAIHLSSIYHLHVYFLFTIYTPSFYLIFTFFITFSSSTYHQLSSLYSLFTIYFHSICHLFTINLPSDYQLFVPSYHFIHGLQKTFNDNSFVYFWHTRRSLDKLETCLEIFDYVRRYFSIFYCLSITQLYKNGFVVCSINQYLFAILQY